jgi:molybdopterin converting factor small subunit
VARIVFVTSICDEFTDGLETLDLPAGNVFQLVSALDRRFPGLGRFVETRASIAVDGAVIQDWTQTLSAESEVLLFPRIAGGSTLVSWPKPSSLPRR